jgi:uncharacterized protein YkwD
MASHRPRLPRPRAIAVLALAATLALGAVGAPPARAGGGDRGTLLELVNETRARHDLRPLRLNRALSRDAKKHTRKMVRQDRIFDPPNLEEILSPYPYDDLGAAAVGCDTTVRRLHRSFLRSDVHRGILLDPRLRRVGIGLLRTDGANHCGRGSFWVTEIFYG